MLDPLLVVLGLAYAAAILWLAAGLRRCAGGPRRRRAAQNLPSASVVVAARDEAGTVGDCVQALRRQDYAGSLDIVVVNDGSGDDTAAEVQRAAAGPGPTVHLIAAPEQPAFTCRKKSALAAGIEASQGEILLLTDADCRPLATWASATVAAFDPGVGLVAGYATRGGLRGVRGGLVALDNLMIAALGAGSAGMGAPLSCTGRNLAYRRRVYDEVGGFEQIGHLTGGDDVYFARLAAAQTSWRLVYNLAPDATVRSEERSLSLGELVHQKLRHAAKAGRYRGSARLAGALTYLFHFLLLLGLIEVVARGRDPVVLLAVWAGKVALDGELLAQMGSRVGERPPWALLPVLEVVYIPYVLIFTVAGRFGWYRWKGAAPRT